MLPVVGAEKWDFLSSLNTVLCYDHMNTGGGNRIGRGKRALTISDLYHLEPLSENGLL